MMTFLLEFYTSLSARRAEIDALAACAETYMGKDEATHSAICRSLGVLLVAHLEGSIKELAKTLVSDINNFSDFSGQNLAVKRTFCRTFVDFEGISEKSLENRCRRLIEVFDSVDAKLDHQPFIRDDNRNPAPRIIDAICYRFGVDDIFCEINNSILDDVFSETSSSKKETKRSLDNAILNGIASYPYRIEASGFGLSHGRKRKEKNKSKTFWESFLDNLLKARHDIAHGTEVNNTKSVLELRDDADKVFILINGIIVCLCIHLTKTSTFASRGDDSDAE